jgi:hypothetical protein
VPPRPKKSGKKSKRNVDKVEETIDTILNIKLKTMRGENENQNVPPIYKLSKFKSE